MTLPLWGLLQRAQDDAQTIEEAIAEAIAAHEADPEAHLGDGESLQMHKAEDVIDHPQGSVLGDKYTNREFSIMPTFASVDNGYSVSSSGVNYSLAGLRFETGGTINTTKYIRASGQYSPAYFDGEKETTWQFTAKMIDTTSYTAYGLAGTDGNLEVGPGIGFKFINNALYAVEIYVDGFGDPHEVTELITGVTLTDTHLYRVHLDTDGTLKFYVDGTEVASWTATASEDYGLALFTFQLKNTASANKRAHFSGPYLSIAIQ
jgi:hypothetical protein